MDENLFIQQEQDIAQINDVIAYATDQYLRSRGATQDAIYRAIARWADFGVGIEGEGIEV